MSFMNHYVSCSYDKSHEVLSSRLAQHNAKCSKNQQSPKSICPFHATHVLNSEELDHHLSTCPSSASITCFKTALEPELEVGTISLDEACTKEANLMDEDWSGCSRSYDPIVVSEKKNVVRMRIGLSKAKKKQFREQERIRLASLANNDNNNDKDKNENAVRNNINYGQPLRAPKNIMKSTISNKNESVNDIAPIFSEISINDKDTTKDTFKDTMNNISTNERSVTKEYAERKLDTTIKSQPELKNAETIKKQQKILEVNSTKQNCQMSNIQHEPAKVSDQCSLNSKVAGKPYRSAKRIITGRGFPIAYEREKNLNSRLSKVKETKENTNLSSVYGYDED